LYPAVVVSRRASRRRLTRERQKAGCRRAMSSSSSTISQHGTSPIAGAQQSSLSQKSARTYWQSPPICGHSLSSSRHVSRRSLVGGGVLAALGQINSGETSLLHSVIAYYPSCRGLQPWRSMVPALSLMGAEDGTARPTLCDRVFAQLPPGTPIEARTYPGARH